MAFTSKPKKQPDSTLVYLVEEDGSLANELILNLEKVHYKVLHVATFTDLEAACEKEIPAAIILGIILKGNGLLGGDIITRLKNTVIAWPPIIGISNHDDIKTRLAVARIGASRYFCLPLDFKKLIRALDDLTMCYVTRPNRVLLIDNDQNLLERYSNWLLDMGLIVETLLDPLECINALSRFKPDVIIVDISSQDSFGFEIVQIIRQDEIWDLIPILVISETLEIKEETKTLGLDVDDILVKPISNKQLTASVDFMIKRVCKAIRYNKELINVLQENKYHLATMNEHNIVSTTDVMGKIISVNDKFCEISGYSRRELLGQNHRMIKSGIHSNSFYEEMWHTISQGKVWHGTLCNRKKNGQEYWVESTIVPFLDNNGNPYKYVSARTDISDWMISKERLERSQSYADIGIWDWDIQNDSFYWSYKAKKLYGYSPEIKDINYQHFLDIIHPEDKAAINQAVKDCLEQKVKYDIEHRVIWPDGTMHWLLERGNVIRSQEGEPLHMLGVVQDVTLRKMSEIALQESQKKLSRLYELSPLGISLTDMNGHFLEFNKAFLAICGYPANEMINLDYWTLTPREYEELEAAQLEALKTTGRYGPYEKTYRQKNGNHIPVRLNGVMVKDNDGQSQIWSIVEDISDKKQTEQALLLAKEEAEIANRAKSEFLSSMSHELRTPMNAIMGFGQLLTMESDQPLNESQQENVNEITKASHHLLELINEVLDLVKIESGRIDLSIETIALAEVIAESLQLITPLAQKRGIEISLTWDGANISFEQLFRQHKAVRADRIRLKQVLLNLLSNGIKYNNENGKLNIAYKRTDKNQTRISISDTGDGLTSGQQDQLFTAFERLGAEQSEIEGTGIGLVLSRNIIELMAGSIGVDSQSGHGSTFWIELPNDTLLTEQKKIPHETKLVESFEVPTSEQTHTVLYIEDNPANLRLVSQLLSRLPHIHMWSAHEPLLGLELAAEHKPDLILLDINLPGLDGFEVLKLLRQQETTRMTPVIAISANAMPGDIKKGLNAGFDEYITKPINVKALLQSVEKALKKNE